MLKNHHRILLVLTLGLLALGLAAHSLPIPSLCACVSPANDAGNGAPVDACLACLLQDGIYKPGEQLLNISAYSLGMDELAIPGALEHPIQIAHPPTLA